MLIKHVLLTSCVVVFNLLILFMNEMDIDDEVLSDEDIFQNPVHGNTMTPGDLAYQCELFDFQSIANGNLIDPIYFIDGNFDYSTINDGNFTMEDFIDPYEQNENYLRWLNNNEYNYFANLHQLEETDCVLARFNRDCTRFQKEFDENKQNIVCFNPFYAKSVIDNAHDDSSLQYLQQLGTGVFGSVSQWPQHIMDWWNDVKCNEDNPIQPQQSSQSSSPSPPQPSKTPINRKPITPVTPAASKYNEDIQKSIAFKEKAKISQFVAPGSKFNKKRQTKRRRKSKTHLQKLKSTSTVPEKTIEKALNLYWDDKLSVREICKKLPEIKRATLNRWVDYEYKTPAEIPPSGPPPMNGVFGDAAMAGWCRMRAYYRQAVGDKAINTAAAEFYNRKHGISSNIIDLVSENPTTPKTKTSKQFPNSFSSRYDNPKKQRGRRINMSKKSAFPHINPHQQRLARGLEEIGMKKPGGNIYPWALDRIAIADEVNTAPKGKNEKYRSFGNDVVIVGHKQADISHSTLFPVQFISGRNDWPPTIICPAKEYVSDRIYELAEKEWSGALVSCTETSFNCGELLMDIWKGYLKQNKLIPTISNTIRGRVIIVLDGHNSRYYDWKDILHCKSIGLWFWVTAANATFKISGLDQCPNTRYHAIFDEILPSVIKSLGQSTHNLESEVVCALRAWKEVVNPAKGNIVAGVKLAGLHPFIHNFDDVYEDPLTSGVTSNPKKKKTFHDIHRQGGWLHDPEIINLLKDRE